MVKSLYLDGCSMVYGQGLPREQSLGSLFSVQGGYNVMDQSRLGKSNLAMVMDTYKNFKDFDVIVLGFTFSSRFYIGYNDQNLDFYPGIGGRGFGLEPSALDTAHQEMHKYFYTVYGPPYCDDLSDMLIDGLLSFLKNQNKKVIAFSWEKRKTTETLLYPYIPASYRLPDGHLNRDGMNDLFKYLQNSIDV